jgi:hypothetical protein
MHCNVTKARSYMLCYVSERVRDQNIIHLENMDWQVSDWIIDSGSTFHCCKNRAAFSEYRKVNSYVQIPNGKSIRAHGIGTVGNLQNVYHVPDFMVNLLSVQQLVSDGYTVTFLPDKTVIMTDESNTTQRIGAFKDVSYRLGLHVSQEETETPQIGSSSSSERTTSASISEENTSMREEILPPANVQPTERITSGPDEHKTPRDRSGRHTIQVPYSELQHNRWGHAYILKIQLAQKNQLIKGLTHQMHPIRFCDACARAKLHYTTPKRTPGLGNVEKPTNKFEKIVADIKGPFPRGINGIRYYVLYIDYVTRKKFIYFLRHITAEEVLETFRRLELKLQSIRKEVKVIRMFKSDNAGAFIDDRVTTYMQSRGITCTTVSPYTHHQQGLVERAHLTLSEMAMSWMLAAYVPQFLWPYAYDHAVLITDMLPTSALGELTSPYIEAYGRIPDGSNIKTFGCDMYALLYEETRQKYGPRATKGIYVGQDPDSLAYRFYNPTTHTVTNTGHAKFNEDLSVKQKWTEKDEQELITQFMRDQSRMKQADIPEADVPELQEKVISKTSGPPVKKNLNNRAVDRQAVDKRNNQQRADKNLTTEEQMLNQKLQMMDMLMRKYLWTLMVIYLHIMTCRNVLEKGQNGV